MHTIIWGSGVLQKIFIHILASPQFCDQHFQYVSMSMEWSRRHNMAKSKYSNKVQNNKHNNYNLYIYTVFWTYKTFNNDNSILRVRFDQVLAGST